MNVRSQLICAWSAIAFAAMSLVGLLLADFIPPISPNLGAEAVAAIYQDGTLSKRLGILLVMTSGGFICPFAAVLAVQMKRIEGEVSPFTYTQLGAGCVASLVLVFTGVFWTAAAFRPDFDPALTMLLNDLGWIMILMTFAPFIMQNIALGLCILGDTRPEPVFPRWVGYYNLWVAVLFTPGGLLTFFKTGPFAWDGLFVWWIPLLVFLTWYLLMFVMVLGVIKREAAIEPAAVAQPA